MKPTFYRIKREGDLHEFLYGRYFAAYAEDGGQASGEVLFWLDGGKQVPLVIAKDLLEPIVGLEEVRLRYLYEHQQEARTQAAYQPLFDLVHRISNVWQFILNDYGLKEGHYTEVLQCKNEEQFEELILRSWGHWPKGELWSEGPLYNVKSLCEDCKKLTAIEQDLIAV